MKSGGGPLLDLNAMLTLELHSSFPSFLQKVNISNIMLCAWKFSETGFYSHWFQWAVDSNDTWMPHIWRCHLWNRVTFFCFPYYYLFINYLFLTSGTFAHALSVLAPDSIRCGFILKQIWKHNTGTCWRVVKWDDCICLMMTPHQPVILWYWLFHSLTQAGDPRFMFECLSAVRLYESVRCCYLKHSAGLGAQREVVASVEPCQ